jgi:twitching motility protein PilJ
VLGGQDEVGRVEMATTNIDDQNSKYQQAVTAYTQGDYEVAATLVDQAVNNLPDDPNSHLLRGHIYYVLQHFETAKAEYEQVFYLTDDEGIIGSATGYLENINLYLQSLREDAAEIEFEQLINSEKVSNGLVTDEGELLDLGVDIDLDNSSFNLKSFGDYEVSEEALEDISVSNPFDSSLDSLNFDQISSNTVDFGNDPFALDQPFTELQASSSGSEALGELELSPVSQKNNHFSDLDGNSDQGDSAMNDVQMNSHFGDINLSDDYNASSLAESFRQPDSSEFENINMGNLGFSTNSQENLHVIIDEQELHDDFTREDFIDISDETSLSSADSWLQQIPEELNNNSASNFNNQVSSSLNNNSDHTDDQQANSDGKQNQHNFDDDSFDLEAFESAFGSESFASDEDNNRLQGETPQNIQFLDDFNEFDDLGSIPSFDLSADSNYNDIELLSDTRENRVSKTCGSSSFTDNPSLNNVVDRDEELFTITGAQEAVPVFTETDASKLEPTVNIDQGLFGFFENASLEKKQWYIAGTVGLTSAVVAALISFGATEFSEPSQRESVRNTGWAMALAAGVAGGMTAGFMGNLALKQIRRTTKDLQAQFDAVREGNLNVQATVYSEDELGYLSTSFNDMARVIFTTTNEAQRKAVEQEEAKENLQRQVIRLLDDVEGAARGDLTVQAEVTADVLGAVADAFNLTIQNLRDIVQQVKVAAREVTKGSTNSETFARALSGDALRQAEELAVTLNSVQVMTESIQRVAVAAKEAETVARDASAIALKGGEAVENTVAGILEIRETVAETTRKVKRLAESSQEINSIVALVSQIASRTNLLALNASIEAARAGEAGRGFAIVADEVRQLADKSAKSLKEIEQIVMQIQSETSSVMTAMEEGTQQVIKGTKLAEEAKRALENIIQVADHIDSLVRSITSDTVEQTETSLAVAQVMQSVELTAQETSQEAQRVSAALQHLVGVSRDLIASVERFRVETIEFK